MSDKIRIFGPSVGGNRKRLYYDSTIVPDDPHDDRIVLEHSNGRRVHLDVNTYDGLERSNLVCERDPLPNADSDLWTVLDRLNDVYQSEDFADEDIEMLGKLVFMRLVE